MKRTAIHKSPRNKLRRTVDGQRGQATVEYVGLAVAVAVLLMSVGSGLDSHGGKIGTVIAKRLTDAIALTQGK